MHSKLMKHLCVLFALFASFVLPGALFAGAPGSAAAVLQPFVERHELAGAVALVADKEKVLSVEAVGFADVGAGKVMATDAVFWIASQTKPLTCVRVLQMRFTARLLLREPLGTDV